MGRGKRKGAGRAGGILIWLLLLAGVAILAFPFVSQMYYGYLSRQEAQDFQTARGSLKEEEIDRRIELARAYNASLTGGVSLQDPYSSQVEEGVRQYARMLEVKEKIGVLRIPAIDLREPIYAGTSEDVLERGIGHMEFTSLPVGGDSTHAVLTGHRGLPTARLFTDLDKVKAGDHIYIDNIKETLAYEIRERQVIDPGDFDTLRIRPGQDQVTLLTCHPYMINTHRLLLTGVRIPFDPGMDKAEEKDRQRVSRLWLALSAVVLIAIGAMTVWWIAGKRRDKKRPGRRRSLEDTGKQRVRKRRQKR